MEQVKGLWDLDRVMRLDDLYEHRETMLLELEVLKSELEKVNKEIKQLEEDGQNN